MSGYIDLKGKKYNLLTPIEPNGKTTNGMIVWKCQCDCGNIAYVSSGNIIHGNVKSCGCLKRRKKVVAKSKPLYNTWLNIRRRCLKENFPSYKNYGGRGIKICEEWGEYKNFEKWALDNGYNPKLSLDRIDNDKGYSPDNCRFADKKTQANNRRNNILFTYQGETHNLMQWQEILRFDYKLVHNRIHKLHWDFEKAISTPCNISKRNKRSEQNGRIFNKR